MNIVDGLRKAVADTPAKAATICGAYRFNYRELGERVDRLSNALSALGIGRGDHVAMLALNCHRYLELYYGIPQLGAAVVPINFRLPPAEVKYILDHSESVAICVDAALAPLIESIRPHLASVKHFISISDQPIAGYLHYEDILKNASAAFDPPEVAEQDLLGLFYTSGTTAEPKGVMLTHKNMLANTDNSEPYAKRKPDDVFLHTAPMFHLADGAAVFSSTSHSVTQAFIPRFDPRMVLEIVARERVSKMVLVPTMINFLLQQPDIDSFDLSSLSHITYGASPIAPDLLRRAMKRFGCDFGQGYGLTEASPLLTVLTVEDHRITDEKSERRLASCGKPAEGVEVRVVDFDGNDVKPGEVGEIIARGPNIMLGYWKRPEDTASAIRDGWLYTGDLAMIDEDGYIYLVDRKKDMIVTGGENVFSTEVEAVLYSHPSIREAAVIPVPDADWGEAVHACIVVSDGKQLSEEELKEFCRDHLAGYKIPRSIEFIEGELPKGGTGKILKKQLRERHWQGHEKRIH